MSLSHTILSLLVAAPYSGYDISKLFNDYVSCYWQAAPQQIYRELSKMEDQGWIVPQVIAQPGRPDKKLYHISTLGQQEYIRWIALPSEPTAIREALLVKVKGGYLVDQAVIIAELERRKLTHQKILATFRDTEKRYFSPPETLSLPQHFEYLTLKRGIQDQQAWVDWCQESIEAIKIFSASSDPLGFHDRSSCSALEADHPME